MTLTYWNWRQFSLRSSYCKTPILVTMVKSKGLLTIVEWPLLDPVVGASHTQSHWQLSQPPWHRHYLLSLICKSWNKTERSWIDECLAWSHKAGKWQRWDHNPKPDIPREQGTSHPPGTPPWAKQQSAFYLSALQPNPLPLTHAPRIRRWDKTLYFGHLCALTSRETPQT